MANTILTPDMITREALRILHQNLNFVGNINRQYDDSFARSGAKIGETLRIRKPARYTIRSGPNLSVQDHEETQVPLTVNKQRGVDVSFSSVELTLDLDDFSQRVIQPAMSVLAANIESEAMVMYKDVPNQVTDPGVAITSRDVLWGSKALTDNLAPSGSGRTLNLNTTDNAELVDDLKGLFNPNAAISEQYREGMVANNFLGYGSVFENTMWPRHLTGTDDGTGLTTVSGAGQSGTAIATGGTGGTLEEGDIVYFEGVFAVHAETRETLNRLQGFVVAAGGFAGGGNTLNLKHEGIVTSGPRQNASNSPADGAKVLKTQEDGTTAIGAGVATDISVGYHTDAFTFATADLEMPDGVDFSAREVMDGISMRIVRAYDINTDKFPCRIDVLFGFTSLYPQLANRYGFN